MSVQDDLIELGLTKTCSHIEATQINGQIYRDRCGVDVIEYGGKCSKHGGMELVKQQRALNERTLLVQRKKIEEELFPKLTKRIMEIVEDPEAKHSDLIKIWMTAMDRIGMAAVQGLQVEGHVTVDAPIDILRQMLAPPTTMDEVLDAEVLEDKPRIMP